MARRVWITGMGIVSAAGDSIAIFLECLRQGLSGITKIEGFDTQGFRSERAGEVKTVCPRLSMDNGRDRAEIFARLAARQAVEDASLRVPLSDNAGIVATSNFACLRSAQSALFPHASTDTSVEPAAFTAYSWGGPAHRLAAEWGVSGPVATLGFSCASGCAALGIGFDWVNMGYADIVLVVGFEALSASVLAGLSAGHQTAKDRIRPFSLNRDGTLLGEGAAVLVLESDESLKARNAEAWAEMKGYALYHNPCHAGVLDAQEEGFAAAASGAIQRAGIDLEQVDLILGHGTGIPSSDLAETRAIKAVMGYKAYETPVVSIKPILGHTLGAVGLPEAIACVLSMKEGILFPTLYCDEPDPECDLDYVPNQSRDGEVKLALCHSLGIGGCHACVALRVADPVQGLGE